MNEWDLQKNLTSKWRKDGFEFKSEKYELICWELMFPSWSINDNRRKWNEISIDFIFYSVESRTFICGELKNIIKGRKNLLSAYCQTIQRTVKFVEQYSPEKMNRAMVECYSFSTDERGGLEKAATIEFSNEPNINMVLLAQEFPKYTADCFSDWNAMTQTQIIAEIENYTLNREFKRYIDLKTSELKSISVLNVMTAEVTTHNN
jgi:hypothetical protein